MTDLEKKKNSTEAFFSAMLVQTAEHTGLDQQFLHFGGGALTICQRQDFLS